LGDSVKLIEMVVDYQRYQAAILGGLEKRVYFSSAFRYN